MPAASARREESGATTTAPTEFPVLDALYPLPPEQLFRQWVLTPAAPAGDIPRGWTQWTREGWRLAAHPDAVVCELRALDGAALGWIIEPLAHLRANGDTLPAPQINLDIPADARGPDIERALYGRDEHGCSNGHGLEGMWVAIVFAGPAADRLARVYTGAIHSIVFGSGHRTVATSHNLVPGLRRDEDLSRDFDPLRTNSYYSFGLTAFRGLDRLLPNHYLDLRTFEAVRHWPGARLTPLHTGSEGAASIVEHSRRLVEVLAREHSLFRVFLSAGRDSRAVLAILRTLAAADGRVTAATTVSMDIPALTDLQAARRLARTAGVPLRIAWRRKHAADAPAVMRAFVRVGEAFSGPSLSAPALARTERQPGFTLAGMAGETARGFFYRNRPPPPAGELTAEALVQRVRAPVTPAVLTAAEAWLAGLPRGIRASAAGVLDLAYVEQRLGCWESPARYLYPGRPRIASPMAAAFNIETMLRLPEAYRAAGLLQEDMVRYGWPELLQIPFNAPTGVLALAGRMTAAGRRARSRLGRLRRELVVRGR